MPALLLVITLLTAMPLPVRPASIQSQQRQNRAADRFGLARYQDRNQLQAAIAAGELVPIRGTAAYVVDQWVGSADPDYQDLYRHTRPWVRDFLDRELGALNAATGTVSHVTSLVRTDFYQRELVRRGNRAAIHGRAWWQRSGHLTGAVVDLGRRHLDRRTTAQLRRRLLELQRLGQVEFIVEARCFHVMVLPTYRP